MEDNELIRGLKNGDTNVIEKIYDLSFPKVRSLILKNSGDEADAHDVFQEALELILLKIDTFHTNFEGMLILICKRKWIDRLRKRKATEKVRNDVSLRYDIEEDVEKSLIQKEKAFLRTQILDKTFLQLSETCQKLMTLIKQGIKVNEIVNQMAFSSANTLYRRKAACMERWSKIVKEHKDYSRYFE